MKDKKASLIVNKIVILAIVVVVIVVFLLFWYNADINSWLRNIPGYTYDDDDDLLIEGNITEFVDWTGCNVRVALVVVDKEKKGDWGDKVYFCENEDCSRVSESKIKVKGTYEKGVVEIEQWFDEAIGNIQNGVVSISPDLFSGSGKLYREVRKDLPTYTKLVSLDGSKMVFSEEKILFCRDGVVLVDSTKKKILDELEASSCNLNRNTCQVENEEECYCVTSDVYDNLMDYNEGGLSNSALSDLKCSKGDFCYSGNAGCFSLGEMFNSVAKWKVLLSKSNPWLWDSTKDSIDFDKNKGDWFVLDERFNPYGKGLMSVCQRSNVLLFEQAPLCEVDPTNFYGEVESVCSCPNQEDISNLISTSFNFPTAPQARYDYISNLISKGQSPVLELCSPSSSEKYCVFEQGCVNQEELNSLKSRYGAL